MFRTDDTSYKLVEMILSLRELDVNAQDDDGCTVLHYAAATGHSTVVALLLLYGASPNVKDGKSRAEQERMPSLLLAKKTRWNSQHFAHRRAPLCTRWIYRDQLLPAGRLPMRSSLRARSWDFSCDKGRELTALDYAIKMEHPQCAELLHCDAFWVETVDRASNGGSGTAIYRNLLTEEKTTTKPSSGNIKAVETVGSVVSDILQKDRMKELQDDIDRAEKRKDAAVRRRDSIKKAIEKDKTSKRGGDTGEVSDVDSEEFFDISAIETDSLAESKVHLLIAKWRQLAWREGYRKVAERRRRGAVKAALEKLKAQQFLLQQGKEERDSVASKLKLSQEEVTSLQKEMSSMQLQLDQSMTMDDFKEKHQSLMQEFKARERELLEKYSEAEQRAATMEERLKETLAENQRLRKEYSDERQLRRKYHNQIEEMKGKIRVLCRVRPLLRFEEERGCISAVSVISDTTVEVETQKGTTKTYVYDHCFPPGSSQEEVFQDTQRLVQSALDGFNVCIFAYGQTGSGKTFTMNGQRATIDGRSMIGIIPRVVREIFTLGENQAGGGFNRCLMQKQKKDRVPFSRFQKCTNQNPTL